MGVTLIIHTITTTRTCAQWCYDIANFSDRGYVWSNDDYHDYIVQYGYRISTFQQITLGGFREIANPLFLLLAILSSNSQRPFWLLFCPLPEEKNIPSVM